MRIALFSECYSPVTNGVVTSLLTLRETLRSWGHTVFVIAPGTPHPDDDSDVFRLPDLPFPQHPYHFARPFPRLPVDFGSLGIQIVHCQHPFTVGRLGADTARRYRLPMVYTAHSLYDAMATYSRSNLMRTVGQRAVRGVVRKFCDRADYVITPSRDTRDALRADGVAARFAVVPNGVAGHHLRTGSREEVRGALGLDPAMPLLLYVGRLGPEKRLDVLLRSVELLARRTLPDAVRDFRVAIVGDGQCREELEALTAELGLQERVTFVGARPHATIGDWYTAADIFALTSPAETQGLVLVEAMLAGLPCVAADYGGPREIVIQGETGLRVPLETGAFATAFELLLTNAAVRRRLGEQGRERAQLYSPEAMAQGVLSVYEAAVRLPRPISAQRPDKPRVLNPLRRRKRIRRIRF